MPNAWPPLQSFVVQGLRKTNYKGAKDMAQHLAETWLRSNFMAFNSSKKMYEKVSLKKSFPLLSGWSEQFTWTKWNSDKAWIKTAYQCSGKLIFHTALLLSFYDSGRNFVAIVNFLKLLWGFQLLKTRFHRAFSFPLCAFHNTWQTF